MKGTSLLYSNVLIALSSFSNANLIAEAVASVHVRTYVCTTSEQANEALTQGNFDLVVVEENLGRQRQAGLMLAERCRTSRELAVGRMGARAIVVVGDPDWDRVHRARHTGASVVVSSDPSALICHIQTAIDGLMTDAILGPTLYAIHKVWGKAPVSQCDRCVWHGATISYSSSDVDLHCTPVRETLLNALMFVRRGQTAAHIVEVVHHSRFLQSLLRGKTLKESAVKMEMARLRDDFDRGLRAIGAPYQGIHFLPTVAYETRSYRLHGNWNIVHLPIENTNGGNDFVEQVSNADSPSESAKLILGA